MKVILHTLKICIGLQLILFNGFAQTEQKPDRYFYGVGFGLVTPTGIDQSMGNDQLLNIGSARLFAGYEKPVSKQQSILVGLEGNFYSLFFNGFIDARNKLLPTFDSIRYSTLNSYTLEVPFKYRYYTSDDQTRFFQLGIRAGYNFYNNYTVRLQGRDHSRSLNHVSGFCMVLKPDSVANLKTEKQAGI